MTDGTGKPRVVSLTAHKSQRDRRRAKDMAAGIRESAGDAQRKFGTRLAGYAVIAWTDDGEAVAWWEGIESLNNCPMDIYAQQVIRRTMGMRDAERTILGPSDEDA